MNSGNLILVVLVAVLLMPAQARGEAPSFYPIQAYLTDAAGVPIDDAVEVQFALYYAAQGGLELWSETQTIYPEKGYFAAHLGFAEELDTSFFTDHSSLWLGIKVEDDQEMQRVFIGSVPFAAYAEHAGNAPLHGHDASEIAGVAKGGQTCQEGQVLIGFDDAGAPLCNPGGTYTGENFALSGKTCGPGLAMTGIDVAGFPICAQMGGGGTYTGQDFALSGQNCPGDDVVTGVSSSGYLQCDDAGGGSGLSGSGSNKKIAMFTSSDTLDDSIITQSSNKIGINDSSPSRTLDITGDLRVTKDFYWGGNKFSSSSCVVIGGSSCSSACSSHGMSCYKAFRIDGESTSTSCSQSGFKFCCCKD